MKKRRNEGFLLIEAVLTIAILAVGITALFQAFSSGLRSTRASREQLAASFLLEARAWEVGKLGDAAAPPPSDDDFLGPLQWALKETAEGDWTRRDVSLAWGPAGRRNDLTLSSYLESR